MESESCLPDRAFLPDTGQDILQLPAVGMMIVNVVCCHQRQCRRPAGKAGVVSHHLPGNGGGHKIAGAAEYLPILACRRIEI